MAQPASPSTSRDPRWRQTLAKARTCAVVAANDDHLSPRYSSVRQSPGSAMSLSWQTTCGAARRNALFSASKKRSSWYSQPGRLVPASGSAPSAPTEAMRWPSSVRVPLSDARRNHSRMQGIMSISFATPGGRRSAVSGIATSAYQEGDQCGQQGLGCGRRVADALGQVRIPVPMASIIANIGSTRNAARSSAWSRRPMREAAEWVHQRGPWPDAPRRSSRSIPTWPTASWAEPTINDAGAARHPGATRASTRLLAVAQPIMFTDIVGSTRDGAAPRRRRRDEHACQRMTRSSAPVMGEHNGRVIKHTGDGIMAVFISSAARASACRSSAAHGSRPRH